MTAHPHITDYGVLTDEDPVALGRKVETAIHDGWQPHGSLSVSPRGDGFSALWAQAVVKLAERWGG